MFYENNENSKIAQIVVRFKRKEIFMKKICFPSLLFLFVLLLSGCICLKTVEKQNAASPLEAELQKFKQDGIPTTIEEINLPEIPDEENGALVYKETFIIMDFLKEKYKDEWQYIPYEGTVKWEDVPEAEKKKVADLILRNPDFVKIYNLLEKASEMECQFLTKEDLRKGFTLTLPYLAKLRSCCRLLAAKAETETAGGNINAALSACLAGLKIPKSLSEEQTLISQLVRIAMDAITLSATGSVLEKGEGDRELYQLLIHEMENERKGNLIQFTLMMEVVAVRQQFSDFRKQNIKETERFLNSSIASEKDSVRIYYENNHEEFWNEQETTYLQMMRKVINLGRKPFWEAKEQLGRFDGELSQIPKEKGLLAQYFLPAITRTYFQEAKIDARLGAAEIGIANRIYRQKYGKFADSLDQLTPEILPALPLDPFTGKDYVYKKTNKGFIVYSVGENLADDGGAEKGTSASPDIIWEDNYAGIPTAEGSIPYASK